MLPTGVLDSWPMPTCFSTSAADGLEVEAHLLEDAHGHALPQLDQTEQEMLGADVVVVEAVRFLAGERQHLLGARREVVHWFHEWCLGKSVTWRRY